MTEQEYKQAKQVLSNAPEGATHYEEPYNIYYKYKVGAKPEYKNWFMCDSGSKSWQWVGDMYLTDILGLQNISDLRTMVEQYKRIAELEEELSFYIGHSL